MARNLKDKIFDCCHRLRLDFDRRSDFLTASGVLSAILLVWAQLWPLLLTIVPEDTPRQLLKVVNGNIEVGLTWTYGALLLALLSFGLSIAIPLRNETTLDRKTCIYRFAISFFELSLLMGIINVVQSFVSVSDKLLLKHIAFWQPAFNLGASGQWLYAPIGVFLVFAILFIFDRIKYQHGKCFNQQRECFKWLCVFKWVFFIVFVGLVMSKL